VDLQIDCALIAGGFDECRSDGFRIRLNALGNGKERLELLGNISRLWIGTYGTCQVPTASCMVCRGSAVTRLAEVAIVPGRDICSDEFAIA
jgi:hypothetical protein